MINDFDIQIQSDEIAEIINWNEQFENSSYFYEED